ncbi:hypothetical protein ACFW04_007009 [Cataglyphis niger]
MDEYDEPSDVEMVPIEEIDRVRTFSATDLQSQMQTLDSQYEKSVNTFTTGIDIFSEEEKLKMEERAKRFGLLEKVEKSPNREENLYSSMGITDDGENAKNARLNVIHMRGTEDMSSKDVFKYFQDYAPMSIEWINDVSCNVVWFDNLSAARAMLGLSKKIVGSVVKCSDRENNSENRKDSEVTIHAENESVDVDKDGKKENCVNIKDINYPLPPGIWRKGVDYPKSKGIFLRFATRMDKKPANAEKRSEYYKKYGNPNFGGLKGILTESRKRMYKQIQQNKHMSGEDDDRNKTKNPWGALSETWGLNDVVEDDFLPKNGVKEQVRGIKERLGIKCKDKDVVRTEDLGETSSGSDSDENWCKRSKIPRMRMHADDEEEKLQKRRAKLRYQMVLNNLNNSGDLRSKLGRSKTKAQFHDPIQVVVTNTNLTKSKHDNSGVIRQDYQKETQLSEKEEGEWQESEEEDNQAEEGKKEQKYRQCTLTEEEEREGEEEEEEEEGEHKEDEEDSGEDSNVPAKEVQGPKGSVIKVVPPKPRIASTVWARLNHAKNETNDSYLKNRQSTSRDLRNTLKGDLRSRIGNHTRGRSPLRIEVKNDKYTEDNSDGE